MSDPVYNQIRYSSPSPHPPVDHYLVPCSALHFIQLFTPTGAVYQVPCLSDAVLVFAEPPPTTAVVDYSPANLANPPVAYMWPLQPPRPRRPVRLSTFITAAIQTPIMYAPRPRLAARELHFIFNAPNVVPQHAGNVAAVCTRQQGPRR